MSDTGYLQRLTAPGGPIANKTAWLNETAGGLAYWNGTYWLSYPEIVNVKSYGAVGNGTTDDTSALQTAIDASVSAQCPCYFPPGTYKITTTLDCAEKRGLHLLGHYGYDDVGPKILGAATGKPIIDICGGHGAMIEGFKLYSTTSTIGILTGMTTVDNCGGLVLKNLWINMHNDKTANNNTGTIGLANKSGEGVTYERLFITANLPMILTTATSISWLRGTLTSSHILASDYATFDTMSCGLHRFSGNNQFWALGHHRPALAIYNGGYIDAGNLWLSSSDALSDNGTYHVGMQLQSAVNLHISGGQCESVQTAIDAHYCVGCDIAIATNDTTAVNGPCINLYGGGGGGIDHSRFHITTLGTDRILVDQDAGSPLTSLINHSTFSCDSTTVMNAIPDAGVIALLGENCRFSSIVDEFRTKMVLGNDEYLSAWNVGYGGMINLIGIEADGAIHLNTAPSGNALNIDTDAAFVTASAGAAANKWLTVVINDVTYKIALLLPA